MGYLGFRRIMNGPLFLSYILITTHKFAIKIEIVH